MTDRTWKEDLRRLLPGPKTLAAWGVLAVAFVWFYWSSLGHLLSTWCTQEDYQHGFVVPIFCVFLLWYRRDMIMPFAGRWSWWGLPFLALWAAMRWAAVFFNFGSLPEMSMLPFFAGLALFVGGWQAIHWAWPSIVFLAFMLPLPGELQGLVSQQLQGVATRMSVYVIQTLGIPAVAQGHVIQLTEKPLDVARACSGLRMMTLFFALCIGAAFVVRKPLWEKLFIVVSAAPIAVAANVLRIVLTAVLFELARLWPSVVAPETAEHFMHDLAGFLMMPIGLLLLWAEMTLLAKLLISPSHERPLVVGELLAEQAPVVGIPRVHRKRRN